MFCFETVDVRRKRRRQSSHSCRIQRSHDHLYRRNRRNAGPDIVENVVHASFSQGDEIIFSSESVGRQCMCNRLMALCHNKCLPCTYWNQYVLNQILLHGDRLYKQLHSGNTVHASDCMLVSELPSVVIPRTFHTCGKSLVIPKTVQRKTGHSGDFSVTLCDDNAPSSLRVNQFCSP